MLIFYPLTPISLPLPLCHGPGHRVASSPNFRLLAPATSLSMASVFAMFSDDKHSDSQSEHLRHVRVVLHADDGYCRGGRNPHET